MANISWTSSSINSFFNTSLNTNSPFSNIYSSLNDAAMIKSGSYKKLMTSYVDELKSSSSDDTTSSSDSTTKKKANAYTYDKNSSTAKSSITNKVLDELLEHKPYSSSIKNTVLDKLLQKDDTVTTEDGTITNKTETTTDTATGTTQVSEAVAGAVIDESI